MTPILGFAFIAITCLTTSQARSVVFWPNSQSLDNPYPNYYYNYPSNPQTDLSQPNFYIDYLMKYDQMDYDMPKFEGYQGRGQSRSSGRIGKKAAKFGAKRFQSLDNPVPNYYFYYLPSNPQAGLSQPKFYNDYWMKYDQMDYDMPTFEGYQGRRNSKFGGRSKYARKTAGFLDGVGQVTAFKLDYDMPTFEVYQDRRKLNVGKLSTKAAKFGVKKTAGGFLYGIGQVVAYKLGGVA